MTTNCQSFPQLADVARRPGVHPAASRYLPRAIEAVARHGVELSFGSFETLAETNIENRNSWSPLSPAFDPGCNEITPASSFCILGRNRLGDVVATQAVRIFDWRSSTFHDEATSMRLFYADPDRMRAEGESVTITAAAAKGVSGVVAYSGAGWYHPDYRHGLLSGLVPRISRAVTLASFAIDFTTAIMHEEVVAKGLIGRSGHRNVDWEIRTSNFRAGNGRCAFLWLSADEIIDDLQAALRTASEVDVRAL
ncbi:MAG: hypothetical protein F9K44_12110 [Hyphomicrobiaceae bacterium]|nr:MAG: hypothetical protein F9K44_12110 [Hyphomicrobiaceae bacterium]